MKKQDTTNYDLIKSMSIDEMAHLFDGLVYTGACHDFGIKHKRRCVSNCFECIKEWLKSK